MFQQPKVRNICHGFHGRDHSDSTADFIRVSMF
jgi:hypothetical protein